MPTVKDVARLAGVSTMTVSNVIHGRFEKVSAETADKVNKIIREIGYVPNAYARSLVSDNSRIITFLKTASVNGKIYLNDPFVSDFLASLEETLSQMGYFLMMKTIQSAEELKRFLSSWKIDGLVSVGLCDEKMLDVIKKSDTAAVLVDSYIGTPDLKIIRINDYDGGYMAAEYFAENNHKKFAVISPDLTRNSLNLKRIEGYGDALKKHALPPATVFDLSADSMNGIVKSIAEKQITAVFCLSDMIAFRLINELEKNNMHVPESVSVIGFDDLPFNELFNGTLTTIHQNITQKGRLAVEYITDILNGDVLSAEETVLPIYLKKRLSVKKL